MWKQGLGLSYIANAMPFVHGTDFWGPVSNFGIPIAAVMDTQKDPEMYALSLSLSPFLRFSFCMHTRILYMRTKTRRNMARNTDDVVCN